MLADAIRYFTDETHILASMSIACGDASSAVTALGGCTDLAGTPVQEDTLFDLASLTKLFTGMLVMRLRDEGLLELAQSVTRYAPHFTALDGVTVDQVLGFEVCLITPERVDAQSTPEEGRRMLYAIRTGESSTNRPYSDMNAMVLKYVIEGAAGQSYMDVLRERILKPLGMESTFCQVPEKQRFRCASFDREHRIEQGRYTLREGIAPGTPHDPKARLLNLCGDDCTGHAGLFSTLGDMTAFCQAVLRGDVLSRQSLAQMACNRTGRRLPDGSWRQFLGCQCYVKHPDQYYSEIPVYEGEKAIGMGGFTGHHLSIDPERNIFALYLGNRVLNRLTVLVPEKGRSYADYGLSATGQGSFVWLDGQRVWSSVNYVHQKDAHFHNEVMSVLGLSV